MFIVYFMQISFTHYVFQTLTYNRDAGCRHTRWWTVSRSCTDYVQRLRRKLCAEATQRIEYVRVIEQHADFNPHVHLLLWFSVPLRVERNRYFTRDVYDLLQRSWKEGYSKPEVLRHGNAPNFAFQYVLKYFLKQLVALTPKTCDSDEDTGFTKSKDVLPEWKPFRLKGKRTTYFGMPIRLLAWSRGMQNIYADSQSKRHVQQIAAENRRRSSTPKISGYT